MTEYERFGLVFTKTRVYKFGHRRLLAGVFSSAMGCGSVQLWGALLCVNQSRKTSGDAILALLTCRTVPLSESDSGLASP
jgi:hypothetical protein